MEENYRSHVDEVNNLSFNFNNNDKEMAKVCFYSMNDKTLFENHYPINSCISDITKDFIKKQKSQENAKYTFYIKNNDSQMNLIDETKNLSYYITNLQDTLLLMEQGMLNNSYITTTISSNKFLKIYVKKIQYFNIPENIEQYIIDKTELIGKPAVNQLKYYVYNKKDKNLQLVELSIDQIDLLDINFFSRKTVYCNAENNLFIYEGNNDLNHHNNNNNYCKFFSINLKNNEIQLISSQFPQRILHSMIFLPEKYIFILGGKNAKEVLYYTIKEDNNMYEIYPNLLPFDLLEPSLIIIDNKFLYAFENSVFCLHILKTNFISQSSFEEIKLKNNNFFTINQKFFGVVKQKNTILFLGGQMINQDNYSSKTTFEFNYISEIIKQGHRKFVTLDLFEKNFIPLGDDEYIQISEFLNDNDYMPIISIFQGNLKKSEQTYTNTFTNGTQKNCFVSIHTKNVNIHLPDNMTSLVGTSSFGEIAVPLYNNYKNKKSF